MKGTLSQWLAIFLALSEGLMLVRKMRSHPLPLLAVSPCNLAGTPLVQFSKSPGSTVRAVLDSRETRRLWRDQQSPAPPPAAAAPFALTVYCWTHFDLFGLGKKHFSVCNEQLQTAMKVTSSPQLSVVSGVLCNSRVAYRWLVTALSTLTEECGFFLFYFFWNDSSR